jgi:hypothetical protein
MGVWSERVENIAMNLQSYINGDEFGGRLNGYQFIHKASDLCREHCQPYKQFHVKR